MQDKRPHKTCSCCKILLSNNKESCKVPGEHGPIFSSLRDEIQQCVFCTENSISLSMEWNTLLSQ